MNHWNDTYNFAGFAIGNGYTDPYTDSNVNFPQTLFNFNIISLDLMTRIEAAGCLWYWDKMDYHPHQNAPECDGYWTEINRMLTNVNIYDLYRTNYPDTSLLKTVANEDAVERQRKL
jgi:hypothetical protein